VGVVQHFLGQAVFRLLQGGGAHLHARVLQKVRDAPVDALGVHLRHFRELHLVQVLVPHCHSNCHNIQTHLKKSRACWHHCNVIQRPSSLHCSTASTACWLIWPSKMVAAMPSSLPLMMSAKDCI